MVATIIDTLNSHRLGFHNFAADDVNGLRQRLNDKFGGERIIDAQRCGSNVYDEIRRKYQFDIDLFDWVSACGGRVPEKVWWSRDNVNEKKILFGFDSLKMMPSDSRARRVDHGFQRNSKGSPTSASRFDLAKARPGHLQAVYSRRFACGIVVSRPSSKTRSTIARRVQDEKHEYVKQDYKYDMATEKDVDWGTAYEEERISTVFICETPPAGLENIMPCLCYQLWDSRMSPLSFLSDIFGALIQDIEELVEAAVEHVSLVVSRTPHVSPLFA